MGGTGLEHTPLKPPKTPISRKRGAESGALNGDSGRIDPDLALIQERWPKLRDDVKAAVMALVNGQRGAER